MEPSIEKVDDRQDQWVYWGGEAGDDFDCKSNNFMDALLSLTSRVMPVWFTEKDLNGIQQRWTDYPQAQPIPAGYNPTNWVVSRF